MCNEGTSKAPLLLRHPDAVQEVVVLKFGSSVLRGENDLPTVVHEIYRHWRHGKQVIAVVSAFGDTTDQLLRRAESICEQPDKSAVAALLATGEAASSALLGLALNRAGIPARVLDAGQAGLLTVGGRLDADPIAIDSERLAAESRVAVVVLPGFVGRDQSGAPTLLGRGGSDLTALFVAHRLYARCILIKDVAGLYTSDPADKSQRPTRFAKVGYETAARVRGSAIQSKAIRFAEKHRLRFSINAIGGGSGTEVGPFSDRLYSSAKSAEPLRVALLGCGTVGGGVYERLANLSDLFTITGVGSRTGKRACALGVPEQVATSDLEALVEKPCDVVVELIGGTGRAAPLIERSLRLRRHVVTANKALIAARGQTLEGAAEASGVVLKYSAAVGGVLPALETIKRAKAMGPLREFSGVLNGTCNFVLDRLAAGETMKAAVRAAQDHGYAEACPQIDLDGIDAAMKLILLARAAFDVSLPLERVSRLGISGLNSRNVRQVQRKGQVVRLVARCRRVAQRLEASVAPVALPSDHPLASARGVENRLLVEPEIGECLTVSGKGAGRWPTTESLMADLLDIRRGWLQNQGLKEIEEREERVA
jgi:homoserine dehydrogenase